MPLPGGAVSRDRGSGWSGSCYVHHGSYMPHASWTWSSGQISCHVCRTADDVQERHWAPQRANRIMVYAKSAQSSIVIVKMLMLYNDTCLIRKESFTCESIAWVSIVSTRHVAVWHRRGRPAWVECLAIADTRLQTGSRLYSTRIADRVRSVHGMSIASYPIRERGVRWPERLTSGSAQAGIYLATSTERTSCASRTAARHAPAMPHVPPAEDCTKVSTAFHIRMSQACAHGTRMACDGRGATAWHL